MNLAERIARARCPWLWDGSFETKLAQITIFDLEEARKSAERKRVKEVQHVQEILDLRDMILKESS